MLKGQVLKSDLDFDKAILFKSEIEVTQDGKVLGSGKVMSHTQYSVKMVNGYFFKDGCEFMVMSMVH
ncbi:hypothetical protein EHS13_13650 [Paenibacillus psychroresistens]|uniref:Uncharacterized protein n=1 Tax=Paenibacillus psychroresistens TaxID=1778678 RepID=A0A6B8RJ12_9BACL|nr:hypothetical protein [Paenibacillus psychroresistens]QGQ95847.1 hypothetical protein EHS13_13650 [Paenibacillus psychroresistens]